ncbi:hypothetical protein Ndes2526A_g08674 [Nannochloris sp. 'desiccata']
MRVLWDAQNGPIEYSSVTFSRQLLQSNPVDTAPFNADWKDAVGICIAFVVSGLANSVGIGGGLFWVPLFNALLGFSVGAAASMSQALVACGTLGGTMYSILLRHPSVYSTALIEYSLAAILTPALVLGVSIGVLLNIITPPLIVSIVLFLILVLVGLRTLHKGIQQKRKERTDASEYSSNGDSNDAIQDRTLKRSSTSFREWAGVLHRPIIEWAYLVELLITGGVLLGFQIGKSQFNRCTWQYGVLFGVQVLLVVAFTIVSVFLHYKSKQKQTLPEIVEKEEENKSARTASSPVIENGNGNGHASASDSASTSTPISAPIPTPATNTNGISSNNNRDSSNGGVEEKKKADDSSKDWPVRRLFYIYIFVILIGMVAGMVGLGGGVLIAPLMMELGVHPQSAAATSTLVVLFSSTIASVTFGLYGRINLSYFAVYGPVCFIGGLVGVFVLSGLVRRYNMASLITLLLGILVVISAGLVAGFAGREAVQGVIDNGNIEAAAQFCSG